MLEGHKNLIDQIRIKWKISYYQLYWICFVKVCSNWINNYVIN